MNKLKCSQNIAIWINAIMVTVNIFTALFCLTMYAHTNGRNLILSLQQLIQFHSTVIGLLITSIMTVVIGIFTLRALLKSLELYVSIEIFALIFLITLKVGLLFGILYEWTSNLQTGVTFSVQTFNPNDPVGDHTIEGIQLALGCCGRDSANDYKISNNAIVPEFVPISCCDRKRYKSSFCERKMNESLEIYNVYMEEYQLPIKTPSKYVIPIEYASTEGCADLLDRIVYRAIIAIYLTLSVIEIICIVSSAIFVRYASQAMEIDSTNTDSLANKANEQTDALNEINKFDQIMTDNENNLVHRANRGDILSQ